MRVVEAHLIALAIAVAGVATFAAGRPASAQGTTSSAFGISAGLQSGGTGTAITPVGHVAGSGTKPFAHHGSVPLFSESLGLVSAGNMIGSLAVTASGIATHVMSNGAASTSQESEADTTVASYQATLALLPPEGSTQPAPAPLLSISATDVTGQVIDTESSMLPVVQTGTASFGSLLITGSLLGTQTLTFQRDAPANTVLYDDPNMTVELNQQDVTGAIECTPICVFVPRRMTANALIIELYQKPLIGNHTKANMQIIVAQDEASLP